MQSNDFGSVRLSKFNNGRHNEKWKCGDLLALGPGAPQVLCPQIFVSSDAIYPIFNRCFGYPRSDRL